MYGLTEAGPNGTLLSADEHEEKAGSIGKRAALNCEIKLVNEDETEVKHGEIGEIALRGDGNMKRYYKADEQTNETLKNGWLFTGDMAYQDQDGFYWIVDRKKDIIISGGVNIFPQEMEKELMQHPHVDDVAIVGVPNPDWGETVKAFVVLKKSLDAEMDIVFKEYLKGKVAEYKIPRLFEKVDVLPRNATGKLLKNQLKERV